jgi:small multidrug resistance pump
MYAKMAHDMVSCKTKTHESPRHAGRDRRQGRMSYAFLLVAIIAEVIATSALKQSNGFTRGWPTLVTIVGYVVAFYLLSLALRTLPTGIAYAIWSGVGIVLVTAVAWFWHGQRLDTPALLGMALIVAGVLVMNLFSGQAHG